MIISKCTTRPALSPCGLKSFDYQIDPYIGCEHYCYYCYVLPLAETDWSKEILCHENIVGQLNKELENIPPQTIYMGYHSDPYQPCESEYRQTRKVLELLLQRGCSASILTKSDLVVRDIEILKEMKDAAISVSVAFNDNHTRKLFEANTVDTEKRIEALRKLKEAGIRTGSLLCPVVPYITDTFQLIDMLEPYADTIWIYGLTFTERSNQSYLNLHKILSSHYTDKTDQIEKVVFSKGHGYWADLREKLEMIKKDRNLNLNIHI